MISASRGIHSLLIPYYTKNPDDTGIFCFGFIQRLQAKLLALCSLLFGNLLCGLLLCYLLLSNLLCCLFLCCHNTHLLLNLCSFHSSDMYTRVPNMRTFIFYFPQHNIFLCVIQIFFCIHSLYSFFTKCKEKINTVKNKYLIDTKNILI